MGLSRKTFCYSIIIAFLMMTFIVVYFTLMLPSLYVTYMEKDNLDSAVKVQQHYMKTRNYKDVSIKNPTGSITAEIPLQGNQLYLAGMNFKLTVDVNDPDMQKLLAKYRDAVAAADTLADINFPKLDKKTEKEIKDKLIPSGFFENSAYPLAIQGELLDTGISIEEKPVKTHTISDRLIIFEGGIKEQHNDYTSYIAIGKTSDALILSILPVMTPQITEIKAIIMGSLPMIAAVVFLLILVASQLFSRRIVDPVIALSCYAQNMKLAGQEPQEQPPLPNLKSRDEIAQLGTLLQELYTRLNCQYRELEQKNLALSQENQRQEVFLRASSHQLKTPIAAALLLTDGMIQEMGKYQNTKEYLPVLKKQLLNMRKIVADILYLNHCSDHLEQEPVNLHDLMTEVLKCYEIHTAEKKLRISMTGDMPPYYTDRELLKKILDNLAANAVTYTPAGGEISIRLADQKVWIFNSGVQIDAGLLPHIFDPFVSSDTADKGRGLGLYVVSYYARVLGLKITVDNDGAGVLCCLSLP